VRRMAKIIPYKREFLSEVHPDKHPKFRLPGVDFPAIFEDMKTKGVRHICLTVEEIVEWDMAPMRKFFHGVQIPAFLKKYNDGGFHPEEGRHDFNAAEIKTFLKAKYLGFNTDNVAWGRWGKMLGLDKPIVDIYAFTQLWSKNLSVDIPVEVISSEKVKPSEYYEMIHQINRYYFDVFNETYDIREMPLKPQKG
jgi:hypothetical protein